MESFINYCFEINLYLLLLYLCYNFSIRKSTNFQFNRLFLLIGISLSLLLPALQIDINSAIISKLPSVQLEKIVINSEAAKPIANFQLLNLLLLFYCFGLFVSISKILVGLLKIHQLKSRSKKTKSCYLVPNSKVAFSFFQKIFIGENLSKEQQEIALKHEKVHIEKLHYVDLLLAHLLQSFLFYNPIIYKYKSFFIELHEFEADYHSAEKKENYIAQLISHHFDIQGHPIIHQFNSSHLKSRIMRIKNLEKRPVRKGAVMLSVVLFSALFTLNQIGYAQGETEDSIYRNTTESINGEETVDQLAEYSGGSDAFFKHIMENTKYPESALKNKISGTVYVEFIVSSEGEITSTKILRGVKNGESLDQEAKRVIETLPGTWSPAKKDGKAVATSTVVPIKFNLSKK